ncbi:MAG: toprim domain-containing protein [Deltaproteobacteria bacterium]|nr:toprim domain-containing protein [Deltaproteobacteria bacterium]
MAATDSVFEQIKARINLIEVIGQEVELKRVGKYWMGLCPFHYETEPSFAVTENFYYCFGATCNAKGDIFTWLMVRRGLSFSEAVREAARLAGIPLDDNWQERLKKAQEHQAKLEAYVKQSQEYLWSKKGQTALDYLRNERRLTDETIKQFGLGYDSKRDAIVIPLMDMSGRLVAYALRLLNSTKRYQVFNQPFFQRRRYLFNEQVLWQHKDQPLYLCEGYFDCMSIVQAGYPRVVALCGGQLNDYQLKKLTQAARQIILVPDNKSATDWKLARRNIDLIRRFDAEVKVLVAVPEGDANDTDPDRLKEILASPNEPEVAMLDFIVSGTQAEQYEKARQLLQTIHNPLLRDDIIQELAKRWGKSTHLVKQALSGRAVSVNVVKSEHTVTILRHMAAEIAQEHEINLRWPGFEPEVLQRIHAGHLIGIAARTNVGKTLYALNLAPWSRGLYSQVFFTLEQPYSEIAYRMARITLGHVIPHMYPYLDAAIRKAEDEFKDFNILNEEVFGRNLQPLITTLYSDFYVVEGVFDVEGLKGAIAKLAEEVRLPVRIVWIDYLGLMRAKGDTEYVQLSNLIRDLARLAKELNLLIIFLHQLSRRGGTGKEHVEIDMLRGSGQIEEAVDLLLGLYRPQLNDEYQQNNQVCTEEPFYVDVIKNRHGPKQRLKLTFYKRSLLITSVHPLHGPEVLRSEIMDILETKGADSHDAGAIERGGGECGGHPAGTGQSGEEVF